MAKNNAMTAKNAKVKKCAIKQMMEDANLASCATKCVKQSLSAIWNNGYIPYSILPQHK